MGRCLFGAARNGENLMMEKLIRYSLTFSPSYIFKINCLPSVTRCTSPPCAVFIAKNGVFNSSIKILDYLVCFIANNNLQLYTHSSFRIKSITWLCFRLLRGLVIMRKQDVDLVLHSEIMNTVFKSKTAAVSAWLPS